MSILSSLFGNYADDLAKAAAKTATKDTAKAAAKTASKALLSQADDIATSVANTTLRKAASGQ